MDKHMKIRRRVRLQEKGKKSNGGRKKAKTDYKLIS
jgi:hypothetical protein